MSFAPGSNPVDLIWPNGENGAFPRLVEASWVIRHDDFYYLFYSGDNCCGPRRRIRSDGRAIESATGPFETLEEAKGVPHSLMLFKSERWLAPGHNSIVTDKAGQVWIIYHAIDVNRPRQTQEDEINSRRILLIDKIQWKDGWPRGNAVGRPAKRPGHLTAAAAGDGAVPVGGTGEKLALHLELREQALIDVPAAVGDDGREQTGLGVA